MVCAVMFRIVMVFSFGPLRLPEAVTLGYEDDVQIKRGKPYDRAGG